MEAATVAPVPQERPPARTGRLADDRLVAALFFLAALVLFAPGLGWGVPHATAAGRVIPWGSDEIAPLGTLGQLYAVFIDSSHTHNPQYPLLHYLVQAVFMGPYLVWLKVTGGLGAMEVTYPFGLERPVETLATLTILARLASLLMGAGVVVAAFYTAKTLWGRRAGMIAATLVLLLLPVIYYSRTSNVDVPALFWTAAGLAVLAGIFRSGALDVRKALLLGALAAAAAATKDASAFAFLSVAVVLVPWQLRAAGRRGDVRGGWTPLIAGLGSALVVYVVASGIVFGPELFRRHLDWISGSTAAFVYPATLAGTAGLLREVTGHLTAALGLPAMLLAVGGLTWAAVRRRSSLWLILPGIGVIAATILPVHFVNFRYVLVPAYCLTFFAAFAIEQLWGSSRGRRAGVVLFVFAAGWSLARGLDLTYQMRNDGRYAVGEWLAANVQPGDRIGYFGAVQKLPPLEEGVALVPEAALCSRADWIAERPELVLVIPQQHFEIVHEWTLRPEIYQGLQDGSLGYRRVLAHQTRGLSSRRPVPFVNPPVQVYMRTDRAGGQAAAAADPPGAVLAGLEATLGLAPRAPAGLVRNYGPRGRQACLGVPW